MTVLHNKLDRKGKKKTNQRMVAYSRLTEMTLELFEDKQRRTDHI